MAISPIERNLPNKDGKMIVGAKIMNYYIPSHYFDDDLAIIKADRVNSMGNFVVEFKDKEDSKGERFLFNLGLVNDFLFSAVTKLKDYAINSEVTGDFHKFTLTQGEVFIESSEWVQSLSAAKSMLAFFNQGKIPADIPYDELVDMFKQNFAINGVKMPVPSSIVEAVMSELIRDSKNTSRAFRYVTGNSATKVQHGYHPMRLKEIPKHTSVFAALTFEDVKASLKSSILLSRSDRSQIPSPLESVIKH